VANSIWVSNLLSFEFNNLNFLRIISFRTICLLTLFMNLYDSHGGLPTITSNLPSVDGLYIFLRIKEWIVSLSLLMSSTSLLVVSIITLNWSGVTPYLFPRKISNPFVGISGTKISYWQIL
jgi:hypothetical protein